MASSNWLEMDWSWQEGWAVGKSTLIFVSSEYRRLAGLTLLQPIFLVKEPFALSKWSRGLFFPKGLDWGRSERLPL